MRQFRFSPIKCERELYKVLEYIHLEAHRMCEKNLGRLLPVCGNIGVFCHYEDEFEWLTKLRKELTDQSDNWNHKYFRLYKPIVIPAKNDIPKTTYTYLYVRKPDPKNSHVGDVDFYLEPNKYEELKMSLLSGKIMNGVRIFDRPDLDLIRLSDSNSDVTAYVGKKTMTENIQTQ